MEKEEADVEAKLSQLSLRAGGHDTPTSTNANKHNNFHWSLCVNTTQQGSC